MAGRNRMPRHPADLQGFRDDPRSHINRGPGPLHVHHLALEEEIEIQHRENKKIVIENRHLIEENMSIERELGDAKSEMRRLRELIGKLRTEKDAKTRSLVERAMKLEADVRATKPLREEVLRLRGEAQKLSVLRHDLTAQIQGLTQDITRLRSENKQYSGLRADVDHIREELAEARKALDYEKKANQEQVEQKQAMEKSLMGMAREIEKLRAEHLSMDRRGHGLGSSSYGMYNESPDMRYSGAGFADGYDGGWGAYSKRPRR
ncbi:hypothetical protein RND81_02G193800 [Saponaria officinalis]|uniref:Protein FLX-like 3 n=1 Tax=Saponaria officinalis TaxID=3572 RepID=A0AAW1MY75_SAPOF